MKFSFGIQFEPQFGYTKSEIDQIAETLEQDPLWDMIWISDHMFLDENSTDKSSFDCWTLMTYLAVKYSKLRIAPLVLCNSYRHPSILAKMVATLDHLSEGRIEMGYGAGWKEIEYNAYGIAFPSVRRRIKEFEEGLQILLALWSKEAKANFSGKFYSLDDAICYPKPFQKPHPRLWIGAPSGGKRMLQLTARYGDGINLAWAVPPTKCETIFTQLDQYCSDFGRDPKEIRRSVGFSVQIYANEHEMERGLKEEAQKRNISLADYQQRIEGALVGTQDQIIEKLAQYPKLGITHYIFMLPHQHEAKYIQQFTDEILPTII